MLPAANVAVNAIDGGSAAWPEKGARKRKSGVKKIHPAGKA